MVPHLTRVLIILASGAANAACAAGHSRRERIQAASGCYRLAVGAWSEPQAYWADYEPAQFKLDTVPAPKSAIGMRVLPDNPAIHLFAGNWRLLSHDSIAISWGGMFGGVRLHLSQQGDTLRGLAEGGTDVVRVATPSAPVTAVRIPCPLAPIVWVSVR